MSKTILSVDDSRSIRDMVNFTLQSAGYTVHTAEDGRSGLAEAQARPVDMVITDLNMPNLNGIDFIKELRKLPAYAGKPIIMLTTESQDAKKAEGKAAGATGWLVKPFKPEQLVAVVRKLVGS